MELLVAYSDSESTDSDKEDIRDIQLVNTVTLVQTRPKGKVHKPNDDLPTSELTTTTTTSTSTNTSSTASGTIDKLLNEVAAKENDAIIHFDDFFGLDVDERSDDSGDDASKPYFVKGNNVFSKPISNRSHKIVKTLKKSAMVPADLLSTSPLPKSGFWSGHGKLEDWSKPEQIWKRSSNDKNQVPDKITSTSEIESHSHKHEKPCLKRHRQEETFALTKSCFFIHHNISSALHQTLPCKPPTRKYLTLSEHAGAVNRVTWAKAEFSHLIASASMDTTVKIWNVFSTVSHCVQTFYAHTKAVRDVTWSPSGKEILSCGYDRTARLNDVVKGVEIAKFEHQDFLTCVKYHPVNPNYILLGSKDLVLCWDIRCPEKCIKTFGYKHNFGQVQDLIFIRDGHEFVISTDMVTRDSADRSIMVYDFSNRVVLSNQVYQERYMCPRLAFHPHQAEMMAQSGGNYLSLFSTIKPYKMNRCKRFEGHKVLGYAVGCGYSADGRLVVSGSSDSKVLIWDHQTAVQLKQLGDPHEIYLDVAWHPLLNSTVASCTWSGHIDIWQ